MKVIEWIAITQLLSIRTFLAFWLWLDHCCLIYQWNLKYLINQLCRVHGVSMASLTVWYVTLANSRLTRIFDEVSLLTRWRWRPYSEKGPSWGKWCHVRYPRWRQPAQKWPFCLCRGWRSRLAGQEGRDRDVLRRQVELPLVLTFQVASEVIIVTPWGVRRHEQWLVWKGFDAPGNGCRFGPSISRHRPYCSHGTHSCNYWKVTNMRVSAEDVSEQCAREAR